MVAKHGVTFPVVHDAGGLRGRFRVTELPATFVIDSAGIVRYAFAPTTPEGFGVTYTTCAASYEFCVNYRRDSSEDLEAFAHNLTVSAETFWGFVKGLAG